ncbi:MAG: hypothetical protein EAZ76_13050 [Nostocales cyanobacterium]|nr:MAG: hypothetical protein EAZ87_19570 [Nostocales cyanobacterium]TAF12862.1 MAG: hypothetical protein EAZ76_13050 [Nostocales cyanobacterium]
MKINLHGLTGLLVILATNAFPVVTQAQTPTETPLENGTYESIPENFNRVFYKNYPILYEDRTLQRQVDFLFGPGKKFGTTFPENEILRDAELVNIMYHDVLKQQSQNDPYLRTPDLPNPYNSSLLSSPKYNSDQLKVGTEYRFDSLTSR